MKFILKILSSLLLFVCLISLIAAVNEMPNPLLSLQEVAAINWEDHKDFLNSNFFTAIIGSLAGAFAGAWGAQLIAEKSKKRDSLLIEIRNINAAIATAFACSNFFISLKHQHVKPLKDRYDEQLIQQACHQVRRLTSGVQQVLRFECDFRSITAPNPPVDVLQNQLFEKTSITGQALTVMSIFRQSTASLSDCIRQRNELVETFRKRRVSNDPEFIYDYLGIKKPNGNTDHIYNDLVNAIFAQTDDGIFFSKFIGDKLIIYETVLSQFKERFGEGAPNIQQPVYHQYALELIPPDSQYADFFESPKIARQPQQ